MARALVRETRVTRIGGENPEPNHQ